MSEPNIQRISYLHDRADVFIERNVKMVSEHSIPVVDRVLGEVFWSYYLIEVHPKEGEMWNLFSVFVDQIDGEGLLRIYPVAKIEKRLHNGVEYDYPVKCEPKYGHIHMSS